MHADSGLLCPYFQSFSPDFLQLEEYCKFQKINVSSSVLDPLSTISEYDWETELDSLKTPALCLEEKDQNLAHVPLTSCGDQGGIGKCDQLVGDSFYEGNGPGDPSFAEALPLDGYVNAIQEEKVIPGVTLTKSGSVECLSSMEWAQGAALRPNFLEFPTIDFEFGMRRAFSEGDIKGLNNANVNYSSSQLASTCSSEDRKEKLSRYKSKKSKRNFDRKIKYACRKALADSQPRIRGRFARTGELGL